MLAFAMFYQFYLIVWLIALIPCAIAGAMIGAKKDEAGSGFFLGLLLGPLGVLIAFLLRGNRQTCPFCLELIPYGAKVCAHCQRDIPQPAVPEMTEKEKQKAIW